jgi:2-iminobutanoate/2-iminopropanoate deaminase
MRKTHTRKATRNATRKTTGNKTTGKTSRRTISNPPTVAPPAKPYYSTAISVSSGPLLFISGQVARNKSGELVGKGDLRAQAVQVLENIRDILRAHNADMKDIVQVIVYVTDMRAYHELTDIRLKYFPKDGPTSTIVEVSRLALPELEVEISAIATL